jgi:hypothetical protein
MLEHYKFMKWWEERDHPGLVGLLFFPRNEQEEIPMPNMFGFLMLTINRYTGFGPFLWILRFHKSMLVQFGGL